MPKTRMKVVLRCSHCRARVRLTDEMIGQLADDPSLALRCPKCERPFSAAAAPEGAAPAAAPAVAKPPFGDLVREPDAPPFSPIAAPEAAEPARKLTLADRWNTLTPRRQKLFTGVALLAMAAVVTAWPAGQNASQVKATDVNPLPPPKPPQVEPPPLPPEPLKTYFKVNQRVAVNTLVTKENVHKLFLVEEGKTIPDRAVKAVGEAVGKYVVLDLVPGQTLTEPDLASAPRVAKVEPPPPPPPAPRPQRVVPVYGPSTLTEYVYVQNERGEWHEDGSQRRFVSLAQPTAPSPPAGAPAKSGLPALQSLLPINP